MGDNLGRENRVLKKKVLGFRTRLILCIVIKDWAARALTYVIRKLRLGNKYSEMGKYRYRHVQRKNGGENKNV